MTKFKILSWILKLFIGLYIAVSIVNGYIIYDLLYDIKFPAPQPGVISNLIITILLMLMSSIGLYFIHQSCVMFIKRSYFNSKSALYLTRGGYILAATALLHIILIVTRLEAPLEIKTIKDFTSNIGYNITFLIIGFALIAVSDIIKKGENIKRENDLTI